VETLKLDYDSEYELKVTLSSIKTNGDMKKLLEMEKVHKARPLKYGNTSYEKYFFSEDQLNTLINYLMEKK
jgi:hypothetical protein